MLLLLTEANHSKSFATLLSKNNDEHHSQNAQSWSLNHFLMRWNQMQQMSHCWKNIFFKQSFDRRQRVILAFQSSSSIANPTPSSSASFNSSDFSLPSLLLASSSDDTIRFFFPLVGALSVSSLSLDGCARSSPELSPLSSDVLAMRRAVDWWSRLL